MCFLNHRRNLVRPYTIYCIYNTEIYKYNIRIYIYIYSNGLGIYHFFPVHKSVYTNDYGGKEKSVLTIQVLMCGVNTVYTITNATLLPARVFSVFINSFVLISELRTAYKTRAVGTYRYTKREVLILFFLLFFPPVTCI